MSNLSASCIVRDYERRIFQKLCAKLIQQGPMPKHMAFIMDGNRRYAKLHSLGSATEGHQKGEEKLLQVINMLCDLNIDEGTFFFLSVDNLKRSSEEITGIIDIMINRMQQICDKSNKLAERGICWDVVGVWEKIPSTSLQNLYAKACLVSRGNQKLKVHLAFSYSAHLEISQGVNNLLAGLLQETISGTDLSEKIFQDAFTLHSTNPVDILVRTGGDTRISDFVLWQSGRAHLEFISCFWPEFSIWDLLKVIWRYQSQQVFAARQHYQEEFQEQRTEAEYTMKQSAFVENLRNDRWAMITKFRENYRKLVH